MLVLRHGGVLSGKVTRAGKHYLLTIPGGQMRVHEVDVEFFCSDLDEAYELKRASLTDGRSEEHLDLAAWCLKHRLHGYAARELIEARQLDPKHPRIGLVERQLNVVLQHAAAGDARMPKVTKPPRQERLAKTTKIPADILESFASKVHPILMNRCSRGGCHGPGTSAMFRLERGRGGRAFTYRMTQRNLRAALQFVNRDNPSASLLLLRPSMAHGPLSRPVFAAADADEYAVLVAWADLLNSTPPEKVANITAAPADALLQKIDPAKPASRSSILGEADRADGAKPPRRIQHGSPLPEPPTANPYDPSEFNSDESSAADHK